MNLNRRRFLATSASALTAGGFLSSCSESGEDEPGTGTAESPFKISLAQLYLNKAIKAGELDNLDYPKFTKETFGLNAI